MPKFRFLPIVLLGLLLIFPAYSIEGASNGILLWFHVVLPTLAPFIICTQMIVALGAVDLLIRPFKSLFRTVFGLSANGTYVLLCGLLCGYPLGAKLCSDFLNYGKISRSEADYLLAICNHPSPMFLLGFVRSQLSAGISPVCLLACMYLPILPVSLLARHTLNKPVLSLGSCSLTPKESPSLQHHISLESVLLSTCETMVIIGGYIMLFSILAVWIRQIPFLTTETKAFLTGIAEITTGVNQICAALPTAKAIPMVIAIVSFGGLSGIFQTRSVIKNAGLSIRHYTSWKIVHMGFSCLIIILLSVLLPLH